VSDIPIIFSAPMVLALLDDRKTMTRRLAWGKDKKKNVVPHPIDGEFTVQTTRPPSPWQRVKPGDRLWVRETWQKHPDYATIEDARRTCENIGFHFGLVFAATQTNNRPIKWRSPIHMPRWASRLTLVVTATKIERAQQISDEDVIAEGMQFFPGEGYACPAPTGGWWHSCESAQDCFMWLWRKLHGADSWDANPEIVVLTFTVHKQNIDSLPREIAA
jgi:hypothetical protein